MIEAWWRSLKHQWLFLHPLDSVSTVRRLVEFYVHEHDRVLRQHGQVRPLVSTALFLEYEDVLMRPETRLATKMDAANADGFLAAFASAAEGVEVNFRLAEPKLTLRR